MAAAFVGACIAESICPGSYGGFINSYYAANGLPAVNHPLPDRKIIDHFADHLPSRIDENSQSAEVSPLSTATGAAPLEAQYPSIPSPISPIHSPPIIQEMSEGVSSYTSDEIEFLSPSKTQETSKDIESQQPSSQTSDDSESESDSEVEADEWTARSDAIFDHCVANPPTIIFKGNSSRSESEINEIKNALSSGSPLPASLLVEWINGETIVLSPSNVTSYNVAPVNIDYLQKLDLSPLRSRALISFKYNSLDLAKVDKEIKNLNECYL